MDREKHVKRIHRSICITIGLYVLWGLFYFLTLYPPYGTGYTLINNADRITSLWFIIIRIITVGIIIYALLLRKFNVINTLWLLIYIGVSLLLFAGIDGIFNVIVLVLNYGLPSFDSLFFTRIEVSQ